MDIASGWIYRSLKRAQRFARSLSAAKRLAVVRMPRLALCLLLFIVAAPRALAQVEATLNEREASSGTWRPGLGQYLITGDGLSHQGSVLLETDGLAPTAWRTGLNRLAGTFSGPVPGVAKLGFMLSGFLEGQKYEPLGDGFNDVPILLRSGIARLPDGLPAVFMLPRESDTPGASDSVAVSFPDYVSWNNGPTLPFNQSDAYSFVGKLSLGLSDASMLDLSYRRTRRQAVELALADLYNPDGFTGRSSTAEALNLSGYFDLAQTATSAMSLDLRLGHRRSLDQFGILDPYWRVDHTDPFMGFNFSGLDFLLDVDDWKASERLRDGLRSNAVPAESVIAYPRRDDLRPAQSLPGLVEPLRLNPYGMRDGFPIGGFTNQALDYTRESNWLFSGRLDWQLGLRTRLRADASLALIHSERYQVPLYTNRAAVDVNNPVVAELYTTGRFDLGAVVIDAGVRWDRFDPDIAYPRVPGFAFNVPDSLRADFLRLEPYDPESPSSLVDRLAPLEDCGGEETAADRTRADGTLVCRGNFIEAPAKSVLSPELSLSFPLTKRSNLRVSYSQRVAMALPGLALDSVRAADLWLYCNVYEDLAGGRANSSTLFGRDIDLPRVVELAAGYRHTFGTRFYVDLGVFRLSLRDRLAYSREPFENPNASGQSLFIVVLTNGDDENNWGVDLRLAQAFGDLLEISAGYSYLDSWVGAFESWRFEQQALADRHLSIIADRPLASTSPTTVDEGDQHFVAGSFSLHFPTDFEPGSTLGAVLADLSFYAGARFATGAVFTQLEHTATGVTGPPTVTALNAPSERLNSSRLPWQKHLNLRFSKGFRVGSQKLRLYADWLNPFDLSNTDRVYLETGTAENPAFRDRQIGDRMRDDNLDGDTDIDDFDIVAESPENALNVFSLLQAESRFGNGDGVFTVEEQRRAFGAWHDLFFGRQWLESSNQRFLLGLEIIF